MKFVIFASLLALAAAAKLPGGSGVPVQHFAILRDDRIAPNGASYRTELETENGIYQQETGEAGQAGQSNAQGAVSYTAPDGQLVEITYVANEFGYQPQGALLPTPPPLPDHVHELLRIAEEQRAQGIVWN